MYLKKPNRRRTEARLALLLAALASAAAAVIHVAAAPAHWEEWTASGLFFLAAALFQIAWAVLVLPFANRYLAAIGLIANLGLLILWAQSRWQGVPIGPHAGVPEPIGVADAMASALEVAIVVGALWALLPRESHGVLGAVGYRMVVYLAAVTLGIALVPGVSSALSHGDDGHTNGEAEDDGHDHEHGTEMETEADPTTGEPEGTETPSQPEESQVEESPTQEEDHTHAPGEEHT